MSEIDQLLAPSTDLLAPLAQPAAPALPAGPPGREIGDVAATRKNIYDNVLNTFKSTGPIEIPGGYKFELSDLNYTDPEVFPLARQKRAILRNETLGRRLQGTMTLTDPAGQVVDRRNTVVARVPFMTDRGNFIVNGVHYSLGNQMRLMPGVFTRRKANEEVESHVNVLPGKGISHRIDLEPETGRIFARFGNARTPIVPFLKILGADDNSIRQVLGDSGYAANANESLRPDAFNKLYDKIVRSRPGEQVPDKHARLRQEIEKFELDPQVTKRTLGQPFTHSGANTVLAAVRRVIDVHNGGEPDTRDAAYYQQYLGPEDFIQEKAARLAPHLRTLLRRSALRGSLDPVQSGAMTRLLESAITSSGLGVPGEEPNPADDLDLRTKITRMGEGGLPSSDSVPMESRMVQPTAFGFIDSVRTAESGNVGVDVRLASGLRKGTDGKVYAPFRNPQNQELQWLTPQDVADKVIALPGEMETPGDFARVVQNGKLRYEEKGKVELLSPSMEDNSNHLLNMIPAKQNSYPHRLAMGARMMAQALPLSQNEAPYVQARVPHFGTRTYSEEYGKHFGAVSADEPGTVEKVSPDGITVRLNSGERKTYDLYSNFPLNRKSYFNSTPTVRPGDPVRRGDLLARSNFTDAKGTVALGRNLYTAYIPAFDNFEDAYTISESAAKRMTAEMMYQQNFDYEGNDHRSKRSYVSLFPSTYSREQLDRLDDDGVIKVGQQIGYGDPITLAARPAERTADRLVNAKSKSYSDRSETWDHHYPGVVTDVEKTKNGVLVAIKAQKPVEEGDKISGNYGDKGVVRIIPDSDMPTDANGRTFDLVANPHGVITRGNSSQVVETILGKIAEKTGTPYRLKDFEVGKDMVEWARQEAARHGMQDQEDIIDPKTGRKIRGVLTGNRYMYRLHHLADAKIAGRGIGGGYTAEGVPSKSSNEDNDGAKRLSNQDIYALMAHGAYGALRDKLYRGQSHPEFWSAWMSGKPLPDIRVPDQTTKFFNELRAAGIKPVRESNGRIKIMAQTDKDVDEMSQGRTIENAETVDARSAMKPIKGGLFDPSLTGGHRGRLFAKMDLHEPYPNPVMEEPIRRVLGLTEKKFQDILAGRENLGDSTGPKAIGNALRSMDLDTQIQMARDRVRSTRGAGRDDASRKLRYLQSAKNQGLHPKDWMLSKVPVLPPAYRPVGTSDFGKEQMIVSDMNYLYRDLWEANQNLHHMSEVTDDAGEEILAVYKALQAVTGLGEPINPANAEKSVKGVLSQIFGSTSKYGKVQRKLLSTPVDMVGRGVIVPDTDLDMDQIGIPEDKAWNVYSPFIVRRMVSRGSSPVDATRAVKERSKAARNAMLEEMDERPVQVSRSPVLHKYGHMAMRPRLISGNAIRVNPFIVKGFGADFDGDQMNFHVPFSPDAVKDAYDKLLPSRNLYSVGSNEVHQLPANEFVSGLYLASSRVDNKTQPVYFRTKKEALQAYEAGEISTETPVIILDN